MTNYKNMNKIDRYKILIRHMINVGIIASQKDLGAKMGYAKESTISQIINEKVKEPKDFIDRLAAFVPGLNKQWLETGEGAMLITSNDNHGGGQHFHGSITGPNPQFAGHDFTNNPPCNFGVEADKVIAALNAQADLTKEAHEITRRAQAQVDRAQAQVDVAQQQMNRLLAIIEQKLNIVPV